MGIALDLERRRNAGMDFDEIERYINLCAQNGPSRTNQTRSTNVLPNDQDDALDTTPDYITIKRSDAAPFSVPVTDILNTFWLTILETNCSICRRPFTQIDPPIRTVSLESQSPLVVQIHSRHLACLKSHNIPFIAVSHVWHQSIASANATTNTEFEASRCLLRVFTDLLVNATSTFIGSLVAVELWHDYVSVPQWRRPVQQALLIMLPEIYAAARLCLIHLEDITVGDIAAAVEPFASEDRISRTEEEDPDLDGGWYPSKPSSPNAGRGQSSKVNDTPDRYKRLATFFQAKWFERMWVSTEFAYCRSACVYTQDHAILWHRDRGEYFDSFSWLFASFQQRLRVCVEELGTDDFHHVFLEKRVPLLGPLLDMRKNVQQPESSSLCFGEAVSFIGGRECCCYRDRFLAISAFLQFGEYVQMLQHIPDDPTEACLWVACRCLERGDYSPLLMLRRDNAVEPRARWLVGHQDMSWAMWDLGPQESDPLEGPKIVWNPETPMEHSIEMQLDYVGTVERIHVMKFQRSYLQTFDEVLGILLEQANISSNVQSLFKTLKRIYGVPDFLYPPTLNDHLRRGKCVYSGSARKVRVTDAVADLLASWHDARNRLETTEEIARVMGFLMPLKGTVRRFHTLSFAANPLHQLAGYNDCILTVPCPSCNETFVYRASILKHHDGAMGLYRIPGLAYKSSLFNGVGLLVSGNEIVGRMIYGTSACDCTVSVRVSVH